MSTEGTVHSGNVAGGNLLSQGTADALISFVLKGGPTVAISIFPGILQLTTGEASVNP